MLGHRPLVGLKQAPCIDQRVDVSVVMKSVGYERSSSSDQVDQLLAATFPSIFLLYAYGKEPCSKGCYFISLMEISLVNLVK